MLRPTFKRSSFNRVQTLAKTTFAYHEPITAVGVLASIALTACGGPTEQLPEPEPISSRSESTSNTTLSQPPPRAEPKPAAKGVGTHPDRSNRNNLMIRDDYATDSKDAAVELGRTAAHSAPNDPQPASTEAAPDQIGNSRADKPRRAILIPGQETIIVQP